MKRRPDARRHRAGEPSLKKGYPLIGTPWAPLVVISSVTASPEPVPPSKCLV